MSVFERSKQRRRDFLGFFLPSTIPDRSAANKAIVAGTVAGLLLTAVFGVAAVGMLINTGVGSRTLAFSAIALVSSIATLGVWKLYSSATIIGLATAIGFLWWAAIVNHSSVALLVAVPFVGGFWTAFRGTLALKRLSDKAN
jgi:hypothetical protein